MEYKGKIKNLPLSNGFDYINNEVNFDYKIITDNFFQEEFPIITDIYINDFHIYSILPKHISIINYMYSQNIEPIKRSIYNYCLLDGDEEEQEKYKHIKHLEIFKEFFKIKDQMLFAISLNVIENKKDFINNMLETNITSNGEIIFLIEKMLKDISSKQKMIGKEPKMYKI